MAAISEFTTDIQHVSGKSNIVADTLSRIPGEADDSLEVEEEPSGFYTTLIHAIQQGLDFKVMASDQECDPDVQAYRTAITGLQVEDVPFEDGAFTLLCDVSTSSPRPIVPANWRRSVFDIIHTLSHPGARTTKKLVSAKFVWHGLNKQVTEWARTCVSCQKAKIHTHTKAPLAKFSVPNKRFEHIHVDLVGPLPESQGCAYLLTVVDRYTRWPEAIPLQNIEALTVARAFVHNWVSRFGVPSNVTSDRGTQFTSELWSSMCKLLGTKLHPMTAYHP